MAVGRIARGLGRDAARMVFVLALGGLLGATLVRVAPGFGVNTEELDSRLSNASIEALERAHAGDANVFRFYLHAMMGLAHGDLGVSESFDEPVRQLLAERFPETLKTVGLGLALAWAAGLGLALAATMPRSALPGVLAGLVASLLLCMPAAVLALMFVIAQAPGRLAVGLIVLPKVFYYARNLLKRSAELPHVLTARAKGAGGLRVLVWHILPVAGPQLLALAGVTVSMAFAAAIPVEVLCDLPGIGQLAWKAAMGRDMVLLVDLTLMVTLITLAANTAAEMAARPAGGAER